MTDLEKLSGRHVSRETVVKLEIFRRLLIEANGSQNLISRQSEGEVWERHILDSAQLLRHAAEVRDWTDVGTGAGFPGLVLAILDDGPKRLIEPRRMRVEFLACVIAELDLRNVDLVHGKAAAAIGPSAVVTARAVAAPEVLLAMTSHLRNDSTITVLPRGRTAHSELAALRKAWQGEFTLVPSLTRGDASILIASHVRRRGSR